jgi:hypothetical protein
MEFVTGILHLIPHAIVIVAVITYVSKRSTPEGTLMLVGSIASLLVSAFYTLGIPLLIKIDAYESLQSYMSLLSVAGILGALLFSIGLLLLVRKIVAE